MPASNLPNCQEGGGSDVCSMLTATQSAHGYPERAVCLQRAFSHSKCSEGGGNLAL